MNELARKYRPKKWDQVLGQDDVVKGVRAVIDGDTSHSFLLTGPSGIGKTTIARLIAAEVKCERQNLVEVDGATNTGIDKMRAVAEGTMYCGFGGSITKLVIVDECHSISKQAWQALLKSVEEPPPHVFWCFCTTELSKVPQTIVTRCATFVLHPVRPSQLEDLLTMVVEREKFRTPPEVINLISRQSFGSPRRALTYLSACYACKTAKEALPMVEKVDESGDAIVLARALVKGGLNWQKAMRILEPLREQNPESIRLVTLAYLTTVAFGAGSDKQAGRCLEMLDCFSEPYSSSEGFAPMLLSLGRIIYGSR